MDSNLQTNDRKRPESEGLLVFLAGSIAIGLLLAIAFIWRG